MLRLIFYSFPNVASDYSVHCTNLQSSQILPLTLHESVHGPGCFCGGLVVYGTSLVLPHARHLLMAKLLQESNRNYLFVRIASKADQCFIALNFDDNTIRAIIGSGDYLYNVILFHVFRHGLEPWTLGLRDPCSTN